MEIVHVSYGEELNVIIEPNCMAIGYFDGLHLGHQKVIQTLIERAETSGYPPMLMTFNPHPREVLGVGGYTAYLTPLTTKLNILKQLGIRRVYVVQFTSEFAAVKPEQFIRDFILRLCVQHLVVGFDFTFGHLGLGTTETLRAYKQFLLSVVLPVNRYGEKVSSTLIKKLLSQGEITQVPLYLGRGYQINGKVIEGEKRGRQLGFPTANLQLTEAYVIPANGVYGVKVTVDHKRFWGVMNIGYKPTFHEQNENKSIEVHLFDFQEMIYNQVITVEFVSFLRKEQKFFSVEALIEQIKNDIQHMKNYISALEV